MFAPKSGDSEVSSITASSADNSKTEGAKEWNPWIPFAFQQKRKENDLSSVDASLLSSPQQSVSPSNEGAFPQFHQSPNSGTDFLSSESSQTDAQTTDYDGWGSKWTKFRQKLRSPDSHSQQSVTTDASQNSGTSSKDSKQLINDLVWLETRIAEVRGAAKTSSPRSPESKGDSSSVMTPITQNIVCRDCFAPPGKLNVFIQSTKDGPCVHSVSEKSALYNQIFPGDLIIAVDDVDTRSMSADHVLEIMQGKANVEKKITVLHFDP